MTATDGTVTRPALPGDLNYIFANVLRDLRDADGSALPDAHFYPAHRGYLEEVLADPQVAVLVTVAADDHNEILAFIIARPGQELIWVHVRRGPLRGRGLARRLLEAARVTDAPASWRTPSSRSRLRNPWRGRELRRRGPRRPSTATP